jgi:hypothetical protein
MITDAGLEHLKTPRRLRELYVADTCVTDAGVSDLQKSRPKVTVIR